MVVAAALLPLIEAGAVEGLGLGLALKLFKKMEDNIKKIKETLVKSSPALQQQLVVLKKSMNLFWRPIADIMAKLVRPWAVWGLKLALMWYKFLNKSSFGTKGDKSDALANLEKQKSIAEATGDEEEVSEIQAKIEAMGLIEEETSGFWSKIKEKFGDAFRFIILGTTSSWEEITAKWSEDWGILKTNFAEGWENLKTIMGEAWEAIKTDLSGHWEDIKTSFASGIESIQSKLESFIEKIKNKWNDIKNFTFSKGSSLLEKGRNVIGRVKEFFSSRASGGYINETGTYQLHAGEKVLNAGDTSRSTGSTMNFNPIYNINATINNDIDIRRLAQKLADLQEREIRRRSSYL